jgi:GPI ethanolamine phosphate transferase 3 subunit O
MRQPSPNFHYVLTIPSEISTQDPEHSILFNTFADPPTSTPQRIKGFTTGSLPSFIEVGSYLVESPIEEDSIIKQLKRAGK